MNHRTGTGPLPNAAFPRTAGGLCRSRKPRALPGRLRRVTRFARVGLCQGPMQRPLAGGVDGAAAVEVQVAEGAGRTSVWDDQVMVGYTHFLLKGLEKVRTEWSLITLAYNLKRVLNLVSFEKMMAAVGVKVPQIFPVSYP